MKYTWLLILVVGVLSFQCGSDNDGDDSEVDCMRLQTQLDSATLKKVAGLELYSQDPSIQNCETYKEALEHRIETVQALINSECTDLFTKEYLEAVIKEDEDEIQRLSSKCP